MVDDFVGDHHEEVFVEEHHDDLYYSEKYYDHLEKSHSIYQQDQLNLCYLKNISIPFIVPFYPLINDLWKCGLTEFEIYNLNGSRSFKIPYMLDKFQNIHKGKKAFIIGNGPSLNKIDMGALENKITFGSNRCFLGYKKWGYNFKYWGIVDRLQIERYRQEYGHLRLPS